MNNRKEKYRQLSILQKYRCGICNESFKEEYEEYLKWNNEKGMAKTKKRTHINLDLDHKIPKSKLKGVWWRDDMINLHLTHKTCNNLKGNRWSLV